MKIAPSTTNTNDVELKKVYETRQALIEKNLNGIYSDAIFKEQNKILEERIAAIQAAKDETVIEKYNLEDITKTIQTKFTDLDKTFKEADLERKRVLMCSIFPKGLYWSYPGYSNTQMSPFYRCFLDMQAGKVPIGAGQGTLCRRARSGFAALMSLGQARIPHTATGSVRPRGLESHNLQTNQKAHDKRGLFGWCSIVDAFQTSAIGATTDYRLKYLVHRFNLSGVLLTS